MKSWKSQWKSELDKATPKLRAEVVNQPINEAPSVVSAEQTKRPVLQRKPFWYGISSVVAVLLVIVLCVTLIPQGGDVSVFVLEINPAFTVSADKDGNVTAIVSSNADADVVLSDADGVNALIGKPVEDAVKWCVDRAAKLGYLDEDNPSAVRVSTADNASKLLSKVSGSLENYFMQRGVTSFVIADVVDVTALCERANLNVSGGVKAIADCVQSLNPVFRSRDVDGLSADELQQTYKSYVADDSFVKGVENHLIGLMDVIEQNEKDVAELAALNEAIESHPDNRAFVKNYWGVKAFLNFFDYGQEFANLVAAMETKLADYNAAYDADINDIVDLYSAVHMYKIISAEELRSILNHFTADFLKLHLDWLSDILQTVSENTPLAGLAALPETAAEFVNKMQDIVTIERDSRIKQFEDIYNKNREQISKADYDSFKQGLLSQYGSVNEMWNSLK